MTEQEALKMFADNALDVIGWLVTELAPPPPPHIQTRLNGMAAAIEIIARAELTSGQRDPA